VTFAPGEYPAGGSAADAQVRIAILEGTTIRPTPAFAGALPVKGTPMRAMLHGSEGTVRLDNDYLSRHLLFLGSIGTGKTNAMKHLVADLRAKAKPTDVFVFFDTKGDFASEFRQPGDAVISSAGRRCAGGVVWNLFRDIPEQAEREEEIYEIASTVFGEELSKSTENSFFTAAARDIFSAVVDAMTREGQEFTNASLREYLEKPPDELAELLRKHSHLAGTARYLEGERTPESILAVLQQSLNNSFSGAFRRPGDFSIRQFVRGKGGRALFIEYDIAIGSRLTPVYRVLMDMAIKEALSLGRARPGDSEASVYFILDEFALLPRLSHITDGINFGRSLGLKFAVGTQNVNQVIRAYGSEAGQTILSGFGTVFAFRLMDNGSRELVRQRFGANRKQISTFAPVRSEGVQQQVVMGNVIEDWALSGLTRGRCIVSLPEGPPFFFGFDEYKPPDQAASA
jgi:hypothetical protein